MNSKKDLAVEEGEADATGDEEEADLISRVKRMRCSRQSRLAHTTTLALVLSPPPTPCERVKEPSDNERDKRRNGMGEETEKEDRKVVMTHI